MNKSIVDKVISVLPDAMKNIADYIKGSFDKSGQEVLSNATGTVGILIKLFAQDKLDKYFDSICEDKLKDFGSNTYLKSALAQVRDSLESLNLSEQESIDSISIAALLEDTFTVNEGAFNKSDLLTIFNPKYHPLIVQIKTKACILLKELSFHQTLIDEFIKHFNENVDVTCKETFGTDSFEEHLLEIKNFLLRENEAKLLWDTFELNTIGFKDGENLEYEDTYASWKPISSLESVHKVKEKLDLIVFMGNKLGKKQYEQFIEGEGSLTLAESLINEYFDAGESVNKILFAVADFGKGKTVFMRQYAAKLAKSYSQYREGYFPIYFNLRNYSKYSSEGTLGVIGDFLLTEYGIRIEDDYFKKHKYIFLIDSLDESGDLTSHAIDKVIHSIKSIQNIDKEKSRSNRILITSRPFPDGLTYHLKSHQPFEKDIDENIIPHFLSIYGFKAEQFEKWLYTTLRGYKGVNKLKTTGFANRIISSIDNPEQLKIHEMLVSDRTLSIEELRRPIFAYMIYQLIINNIDFSEIGKIGIYLSFINLLTKEAKHINDSDYVVDLHEEIRYRNILHSIAALWTYERIHGQQGILKKADICRVLEGKQTHESDIEILQRYKKAGVNEIEFLSHSYFGENNNVLHFQHQSFAEILLAEYYLKIFIKYALDKKSNIQEARYKLSLGEPTEQTILFLKELLKLLRETVSSTTTNAIIDKRRLLYPLFASLAQEEDNVLYSDDLFYDWFRVANISKESKSYPEKLLRNWAVNQEKLEKIVNFSAKILDSEATIAIAKSECKSVLFNNELTVFQNTKAGETYLNQDKWIALIVGNILYNNCSSNLYFNAQLKKPSNLFEMIRTWNYSYSHSAPQWAREFFTGIDLSNVIGHINCENLDLSYLNFSASNLKNVNFSSSDLQGCDFTGCNFDDVGFTSASLIESVFDGAVATNGLTLGHCRIAYGVLMPTQMADKLMRMGKHGGHGGHYLNNGAKQTHLSFDEPEGSFSSIKEVFKTFKGLFEIGLKYKAFDRYEIKSWFTYSNKKQKQEFESLIDKIRI